MTRTLCAFAVCIVMWPADLIPGPAPVAAAGIALTPIVADVLAPPIPVAGSDGRRHLVYELRLGNASSVTVELRHIDVLDRASGKSLLRLDRSEIARRLSLGGRRGEESADIRAAQFGVLFLHVALDAGTPLPRALEHRAVLRMSPPGSELTVTGGETPVMNRAPIILGPPLIGAGYVAGDGCCDTIRHVRALLPLNGRFSLAQRFAIDWVQADSTKRIVAGDSKVLANHVIYGKHVLAGAEGKVIAMRNDLPEQVPGALPANLPVDQADGNFVVLDIGGGAFVLYAHMQPGSVTVTNGAKVKRGTILGKVGNSGNTDGPHLHLHVMDGPAPLVANGLPYVHDAFTLMAVDRSGTADLDKAATGTPLTLTPEHPPRKLRNVLPLDLSVVEFSR